jgi:glycine cleavage system H protein
MKKFTKEHEWVEIEGNTGTIGISNYAQEQLGDVVYVSMLSEVGDDVNQGDEVAEIESVKSVSQIYSPVDGKVTEFNGTFEDESKSGIVNEDPYGDGWIFKIEVKDSSQLDSLMDEDSYNEFIKTL